jgi:hypothetical protein
VISKMISTMISPAVLSDEPCQVYFTQYGTHHPAMGGESRRHDESTQPAEAAHTNTAYRGDPGGMRSLWTIPATRCLNPGRKAQRSLSLPMGEVSSLAQILFAEVLAR